MDFKYSFQDIENLPLTSYQSIRSELKTGDIFFCSGNYFISKMIKKMTHSYWSHVGIIYKDNGLDRILFLESEMYYGVRIAPLSKYVSNMNGRNKPYDGIVCVARLKNATEEQLKSAVSFGMDELTRPYDNGEMFHIIMRVLFKRGRKIRDKKYVCSEYVYECFNKAGIKFDYNNKYISPQEIWNSPELELKFRIL